MRRLLIAAIRAYQRWLSPLLGGQCRFLPSCSEYAALAIEEWGPIRGSLLAGWRLLRCQPFSAGGLDLPPDRIARGTTSLRRSCLGHIHGS